MAILNSLLEKLCGFRYCYVININKIAARIMQVSTTIFVICCSSPKYILLCIYCNDPLALPTPENIPRQTESVEIYYKILQFQYV